MTWNFKGNRTLFYKTSEIPYQDPTVRAWSRWSLNEAESLKRNERGRPYARQPFTKCTSGLGCWYCSPLGLSYVIFFSNFNQHLLYIYFRVQNKRSRTFIGFWIFYTPERILILVINLRKGLTNFPCYKTLNYQNQCWSILKIRLRLYLNTYQFFDLLKYGSLQYAMWAIRKIEKTPFNQTFAGWKSMHQGVSWKS